MRETCSRCRRPAKVCYCGALVELPTRTRVVFLQHPRERRMPVGTARMAHLSLPNSELHDGVCFEGHPRVDALLREPGTALLFPGGRLPAELPPQARPKNLVVVDGTWPQARKVLRLNPGLLGLPRIGLVPPRPGNYRIRREPSAECVSTIEAAAYVLAELEGDRARAESILGAFDRMVELQLWHEANRDGPARHRRKTRGPWLPPELRGALEDVVVVSAEGNGPAPGPGAWPEPIHLVAMRLGTQERFEAIIAPHRPLGPTTARHAELDPARLLNGEPLGEATSRWRAFLGSGASLLSWGHFTGQLLVAWGLSEQAAADLRHGVAKALSRSAGGVEAAAERLSGGAPRPWASGRAGRRVAALEAVAMALRARAPRGPGEASLEGPPLRRAI